MILAKTLQRTGQLMSVATKVGIQINAKLGGEIWAVSIPVRIAFTLHSLSSFRSSVLVENVDDRRHRHVSRQSISFVSNGWIRRFDQSDLHKILFPSDRTTFAVRSRLRTENSDERSVLFIHLAHLSASVCLDALQKYHQVNGILPAKIIVYRDGVNDIELLDVIDRELPALNELCTNVQEGYE